jgi:hypothetical protein
MRAAHALRMLHAHTSMTTVLLAGKHCTGSAVHIRQGVLRVRTTSRPSARSPPAPPGQTTPSSTAPTRGPHLGNAPTSPELPTALVAPQWRGEGEEEDYDGGGLVAAGEDHHRAWGEARRALAGGAEGQ